MFSMSTTILSGCPSDSTKYQNYTKNAIAFKRGVKLYSNNITLKKEPPKHRLLPDSDDLPTATLVKPGKSIRVKLTTAKNRKS